MEELLYVADVAEDETRPLGGLPICDHQISPPFFFFSYREN